MKKLIVLASLLVTMVILGACGAFEEDVYIYNGKEVTETELEDILDNTLELENPGIDIEVDIYEDTED